MQYQNKKNKFLHTNIIFQFFSKLLYYIIAFPVLLLINKLVLGFKVEGLKNIHGVDGSKITVSNHVHYLDCTMIGLVNFPNQNYFISQESNFEIPIVKWLITLLNTIPIPRDKSQTSCFSSCIDSLLSNEKTVHLYPEGSLLPYCKNLRSFKRGAFHFAVKNNVPIIPCTFVFCEPTGIYKIFKRKPTIKLVISKPMYPNLTLEKGEAILDLKNRVYFEMNRIILNYNIEQSLPESSDEVIL